MTSRDFPPGPAYNSRQLDKGDVVVEIDGKPVTNENLSQLLVGSDIAGTAVTIGVRKGGKTGTKKSVTLLRMPSEAIADRRRLFELFTASELSPSFCARSCGRLMPHSSGFWQ